MAFDPIDPGTSSTSTEMRVRFCETDLMGIVHHSNYLVYFEAARVEWLRRRGVVYTDWASRGIHLPVVEANVAYKSPLRFDDVMVVKATLTQLRTVSLKFEYTIDRDGTRIAEGFTRLACVDGSHKLLRFPQHMLDVMLAPERHEHAL